MNTARKFVAMVAVALLAAPLASRAAVVSYQVVGVVNADGVDGNNGALPSAWSGAVAGTPFSVVYEIDEAFMVPDLDSSSSAQLGTYRSAIFSMVVTVDGQSFALPLGTGGGDNDAAHTVADNRLLGSNYVDNLGYTRVGCVNFASGGQSTECYRGSVFLLQSSLSPDGPNVLDSDDPVSFPSMFALFETREFRFSAANKYLDLDDRLDRDGFVGTIAGITRLTAVPLPAAAWLLLSGLAGLGVLGRRRKAA